MLLVWTLGIWLVWLKTRIHVPLDGHRDGGEVPRGWKSLLHLASTMQRDLSAADISPALLTDGQLQAEMRRRFKGGRVLLEPRPDAFAITAPEPGDPLPGFLWQKINEQKWCVLACILHFGLSFCAALSGALLQRWVLFSISWLNGLIPYAFLFFGRRKLWLLWLYLPCTCTLAAVTFLYGIGIIGDPNGGQHVVDLAFGWHG